MKFKEYLSYTDRAENINEATEYYQGEFGFDYIEKEKNIKLKTFLSKFHIDDIRKMFIKVVDNKLGNIVTIKLPNSDCEFLNTIIDKLSNISESLINEDYKPINIKKCSQVDFKVDDLTFRFYLSGGKLKNITSFDGKVLNIKTPSTAQQEGAVVFILNSSKYPSDSDIRLSQGFDFGQDWLHSFKETYNLINSYLKISNYKTYRDSDKKKPAFINMMTQDDILPDKKDNWNPADIWMVKKGYDGKDIENIVKKLEDGVASISDLNHIVNSRFKTKDLIGISLKKIEKNGKLETIHTDSGKIQNIKVKTINKGRGFSVLNSYLDINYTVDDNGIEIFYFIRFRPRGKSGAISTYFEGQPVGTTVRDGAVSKDMLTKKYFNKKDLKVKEILENTQEEFRTVKECALYVADKLGEKKFKKFIEAGAKNKLVVLNDIEKRTKNHYEIIRATMLIYYVYLIENSNTTSFLRDCYLSAKKMNDFSSVHLKIS